ncbi:MAG: hypothetical protein K2X47_06980, partial [Bdellovibrionales bacterium]|nr:hypothetical protein [Bdellovibrionales bacterium]
QHIRDVVLGTDGNFAGGEEEFVMSSIQYATEVTARRLASALGAQVAPAPLESPVCRSKDIQYDLLFTQSETGRSIRLNAGLVANTFNNNNEWLAVIKLRSELAREFGMTVPTWDQVVAELACGRPVLNVTVKFDGSLAMPACR